MTNVLNLGGRSRGSFISFERLLSSWILICLFKSYTVEPYEINNISNHFDLQKYPFHMVQPSVLVFGLIYRRS